MFVSDWGERSCENFKVDHFRGKVKKVKSAYEPSGPSGRSLSRFP